MEIQYNENVMKGKWENWRKNNESLQNNVQDIDEKLRKLISDRQMDNLRREANGKEIKKECQTQREAERRS